MTTYNDLKAEAERQAARLHFVTDPQNRRILQASIADLVKALKNYPTGLIWAAEPKPEGPGEGARA